MKKVVNFNHKRKLKKLQEDKIDRLRGMLSEETRMKKPKIIKSIDIKSTSSPLIRLEDKKDQLNYSTIL